MYDGQEHRLCTEDGLLVPDGQVHGFPWHMVPMDSGSGGKKGEVKRSKTVEEFHRVAGGNKVRPVRPINGSRTCWCGLGYRFHENIFLQSAECRVEQF